MPKIPSQVPLEDFLALKEQVSGFGQQGIVVSNEWMTWIAILLTLTVIIIIGMRGLRKKLSRRTNQLMNEQDELAKNLYDEIEKIQKNIQEIRTEPVRKIDDRINALNNFFQTKINQIENRLNHTE